MHPVLRRWLRAGRGPRRGSVVCHPDYGHELAVAELDPLRAARILSFLLRERLVGRRTVLAPEPLPMSVLGRVHTDVYLESLEQPSALLPIVGFETSEGQREAFIEAQKLVVAGTVLATDLALARRSVAVHLGGGLHHAHADRGQGFCAFNDVAVAIAEARAHGFRAPVLVIDLDLHDGDGTRAIFRDDDSVHTFSIHNRDLGEREATASTSIALGSGVGDDAYLDAVRGHLPPVLEKFGPGLVVYLAGTDPAAGDRLGDWNVSADGLLDRDRFVLELLRDRGTAAVVMLLAGGYGRETWRYTARSLSWLFSGGEIVEPAASDDLSLAHYREMWRGLRRDELDPSDPEEWALTEEDVLGSLTGHDRPSLFLDHLSRHGIELALERSGLLDRLRALGYDRLRLDVDLADQAGQTIRVFGEPETREPLMEIRARRDRSTVAGMTLLRIEWLSLQNPRAEFTHERAKLPGQHHPGLGMLKDVVAVLAALCERIGLDGLVFAPSYYHLAAQSPDALRFLEPRAEALFRAMRDALEPLTLDEAARAVEQGRLVDARTSEIAPWQPAAMVLPVSARLKARLTGEEYEDAVAAARRTLKLVPS